MLAIIAGACEIPRADFSSGVFGREKARQALSSLHPLKHVDARSRQRHQPPSFGNRRSPISTPVQQWQWIGPVCAKRLCMEERIVEYPVRKEGSYTIISLSGELDLSVSPQARNQILACVEGSDHVLVEMAQVEYIDSSGIASLVEGLQAAKRKQGGFGLVSVSKSAMQVLRIARLDSIFPIYGSTAEALDQQP